MLAAMKEEEADPNAAAAGAADWEAEEASRPKMTACERPATTRDHNACRVSPVARLTF